MTSMPLRFPPDANSIRKLRQDVRATAARLGASAEACDALALVVDELANNAIEHGSVYRKAGADLAFQVALDGNAVVLDFYDPEMPSPLVQDLAQSLRDAADGTPALDSERGRGLFLISIYMEELRVAVAPQGGLHLRGRLLAS
jgi:anti-sigma regulatory factor (Ser/Thr protein kinase)